MWTPEQLRESTEKILAHVRDKFTVDGGIRPVSYLFGTHNPKTGADETSILCAPVFGSFDDEEKDIYANVLRQVAKDSQAIGILFVSEVWTLPSELVTEEEIQKCGGRLDDHPNRQEVVYVSFEHQRNGTTFWTAPIVRENDAVTLGPWTEIKMGRRVGRFVDILPQLN